MRGLLPLGARLPAWALFECFLCFLVSLAFYVGLQGELPYHDAARFAAQIESDRFVWDIAHIALQPATLLWHRLLAFGGPAVQSQKEIHAFSTALGVAVFYGIMIRLGVGRFHRACAVVMLIGSASLIILAPSAHMKLVTFPMLNGAIYFAVLWELKRRARLPGNGRDLMVAGMLLAVATAFLASCLAAAPFVFFAALAVGAVSGTGWRGGFRDGFSFALICGVLFLALACLGFVLLAGQPLSLAGLSASISAKADIGPPAMPLLVRLTRSVFGTINNFVYAPVIGSTVRAWIGGEVPSLRPYIPVMAREVTPWLLILLLIGIVYWHALRGALRGTVCYMALAFLAGAHTWSIYYSLNDPEHWFLASVPTILLLLTAVPWAWRRWLVPSASVLVLAANLYTVGLPMKLYPLGRYDNEVTKLFTDKDLVLDFAAYPGGPYLGFFALNGIDRLPLDQLAAGSTTPDAFFAAADELIDRTLRQGGRVVAFGVFDPENWDAPWPAMRRLGLPKARFLAHFNAAFKIRQLDDIAGLKAWEVTARVKP